MKLKKTKYDMSVDILSALLNISNEKANQLAESNHSEFKKIMKHKREEIFDMHLKAMDVLNKGN